MHTHLTSRQLPNSAVDLLDEAATVRHQFQRSRKGLTLDRAVMDGKVEEQPSS